MDKKIVSKIKNGNNSRLEEKNEESEPQDIDNESHNDSYNKSLVVGDDELLPVNRNTTKINDVNLSKEEI